MESICLRHTEIPGTSKLFAEFAYQFPKTAPFFRFDPYDPASLKKSAELIRYPADRRAAMTRALAGQGNPAALLEKFARPETVAVITGQQVGLFTGPAYTIFKALTAVRMAEELSASGIPAVPIFWLASEDHDFAEVADAWVYDRNRHPVKLSVPGNEDGRVRPVGGLSAAAPIDALRTALTGFPHASDILDAVADAYRSPQTMAGGFRKLLISLLGAQAPLMIDPLDPAVREIGAPFMAKALAAVPDLKASLLERNAQLAAAGYHAQVLVEPKTSLFFLLENGERKTLRLNDTEYVALADRATAVSPNALLRPVWQDFLLPTVCYVGGPGEIAYFAQSSALYEPLLGRMPVIAPRAAYSLVDERAARLLKRHKLRVENTFCRLDQLQEKIGRHLIPASLASEFQQTKEAVEQKFASLRSSVAEFDPTLGAALAKSHAKVEYQLEKSRLKAERETFRRNQQASADAVYLHDTFYPHSHLQERFYSILPFLAEHGTDLVPRIAAELRWDCPDHRITEVR